MRERYINWAVDPFNWRHVLDPCFDIFDVFDILNIFDIQKIFNILIVFDILDCFDIFIL